MLEQPRRHKHLHPPRPLSLRQLRLPITRLRPTALGVLRPQTVQHKAVALARALGVFRAGQAEGGRPGEGQEVIVELAGGGLGLRLWFAVGSGGLGRFVEVEAGGGECGNEGQEGEFFH